MSFGASLGTATAQVNVDISQAMRSLDTLQTRLSGMGNLGAGAFDNANKQLKSLGDRADEIQRKFGLAGKAMLGFGAIVGAGFGIAVKSAMDFEHQMDAVEASLGGVGGVAGLTTAQMKSLNDEAIRIGATTTVSASEAAQAMELMAKAGISATDILHGGAQAAVDLSVSVGESVANSAATISSMMNLFQEQNLGGAEAADVLTVAMNNSNASLTELMGGVLNMAPVILSSGMSFSDAAADIAFFNSQGLSAAETGGHLNAMYRNLVKPTTKQAEAQRQLGIEVYDSNGQFVGFTQILDDVIAGTKGMNQEERDAILNKAFLASSQDILNIAIKNGTAGLKEGTAATKEQGAAAKSAEIRMSNFSGAVEQLRGALDSMAIIIGQKLLPILTPIVNKLADWVSKFTTLSGQTQTIIALIVGVTGAIAGLTGGILVALPTILRMTESFIKLGTALLGIAPELLLLAAVLAIGVGLFLAYQNNVGGLHDRLQPLIASLSEVIAKFTEFYTFFHNVQGFGVLHAALDALGLALERVTGNKHIFAYFDSLAKATDRFGRAIRKFGSGFDRIFKSLLKGNWKGVASGIQKSLAGVGDFLGAFPKLVGTALKGIDTGFAPLDRVLHTLGSVLTDIGRLIQEVFQGDWAGALVVAERLWGHFTAFLQATWDLLWAGLKAGFNVLRDWFSGVDWGNVFDAILGAASGVASAIWDYLVAQVKNINWGGIWDFISNVAGALWDKIQRDLDTINWASLWQTIKDRIGKAASVALEVTITLLTKVAGWLWDQRHAVWDAIKQIGGFVFGVVQEVISVVITLLTRLAGWLWEQRGAVWAAIKTVGGFVFGVAQEALSVVITLLSQVAGWLWDQRSAVWDAIKTVGGIAFDAATEALAVTITLLTTMAGWLWDQKDDVWSAIKTVGNISFAAVSEALAITIDGVVTLAGDLAALAADAWGWIRGKILGGGSISQDPASPMFGTGQPIDVGVISVLAKVGSMLLSQGEGLIASLSTQIQAWTDADHPALTAVAIDVNSFSPIFSDLGKSDYKKAVKDTLEADPIQITPQIEINIHDAVANWVAHPRLPTETTMDDIASAAQWMAIIPNIGMNLPAAVSLLITTKVGPDLLLAAKSALSGVLDGLFKDTFTEGRKGYPQEAVADPGLGKQVIDLITTSLSGAAATFKPDLSWIGTALQTAIDAIIQPTLPGWLKDLGWITSKISDLTKKVGELKDLAGQIAGLGDDVVNPSGEGGGGGGKGFRQLSFDIPPNVDGIPTKQAPTQTVTTVFDADTGPLVKAYTDAFAWGTAFATHIFRTTFDADTGPAATAYTNVFTWGDAWDAKTFESTFDADTGPAAIAYTNVFTWGDAWEGATFTATFDADSSGVMSALNNAVALGQAWDRQTFTADFNISQHTTATPPTVAPVGAPRMAPFGATLLGADAGPMAMAASYSGAGMATTGYHTTKVPVSRATVPVQVINVDQNNYALSAADLDRVLRESQTGADFARDFMHELDLRRDG